MFTYYYIIITIFNNDFIDLATTQDVGEGWVEAVKENGEQGLVPASYIDYEEYEVMQVTRVLPTLNQSASSLCVIFLLCLMSDVDRTFS